MYVIKMSIDLKSKISKNKKLIKNDSPFFINVSSQSKPKDFTFSNSNRCLITNAKEKNQNIKFNGILNR